MLVAAALLSILTIAQPFTRDEWNRGSTYVNGGSYEIVNVKTGKTLDLSDGALVTQSEARGIATQYWQIRESGVPGRYQIVNRGNGAALAEMPAEKKFTAVMATQVDNDASQDWRIESYGDGSVMLVAASGKVLDIPGGNKRDGVAAQTFLRNGDSNQRFHLRPVAVRETRRR